MMRRMKMKMMILKMMTHIYVQRKEGLDLSKLRAMGAVPELTRKVTGQKKRYEISQFRIPHYIFKNINQFRFLIFI